MIDHEEAILSHTTFHRTRCPGWLAATGNRPRRGVIGDEHGDYAISKGPVPVYRVRNPQPWQACDLHPFEEGDL